MAFIYLWDFQAMMDRDEKDNLPKMQIGFIDSICLPLYRVSRKCLLQRENKNKILLTQFSVKPKKKGSLGIVPMG